MTAPVERPDLVALALSVRPDWNRAPMLGHLKEAIYGERTTDDALLAMAIVQCYRDPETGDPRRLAHRGPACHWWKPITIRPDSARERYVPPTDEEVAAQQETNRAGLARVRAAIADATRPKEMPA